MTRFCMDCKKHLGEKCPHCGSLDVREYQSQGNPHFYCNDCGNTFPPGHGGNTDGLCENCASGRRLDLLLSRCSANQKAQQP